MKRDLQELRPCRKTGHEQFHTAGSAAGFDLQDFWRWSNSDLLDNTARGVVAEYIVARALGVPTEGVRVSWTAWDLETSSGLKIEVKSSAYIQSWHQERLSLVQFGVRKRLAWDPKNGGYEQESKRHAHVYVFAVLAHQQKQTIDPLDLSQWSFYVVPTRALDERKRSQHSITLRSLEALAGPRIGFHSLKEAVERISREHGLPPFR